MKSTRKAKILLALAAAVAVPVAFVARVHGSDHADTPALAARPGADITDVFAFPDPANAANVILAMDVHPLITPGQISSVVLDPDVLYQFKIDNSGDHVEDLVIQVHAEGSSPATQRVFFSTPVRPNETGTSNTLVGSTGTSGAFNSTFSPTTGMTAFVGPREDPFFFDLSQFFTIFPDRATPINGKAVSDPNVPKSTTWRAPGVATDFLAGYNVISIVVSVPKASLKGSGTGKINLWATTGV
jgi:hypothetical protein